MEKYSLVDCFAGKAAISRAFALQGYKHATLDLEYGPDYVSQLNHCEVTCMVMFQNHKWVLHDDQKLCDQFESSKIFKNHTSWIHGMCHELRISTVLLGS